uniref:RNA-directed DNA polymerase n=1 Tax=Anoplophora glabripennis TaxID=217634 RepID=V5GHR5_ANOGL
MDTRNKNKSKEQDDVGESSKNEQIENTLINLTKLMEQININLCQNSKVLCSGMGEIKLSGNINNRNNSRVGHYWSMWKELDGSSLQFTPDGGLHPVAFIRRIESLFDDAGVPENKRVALAVNALRESAADWGQIKQDCCRNFNDFKIMFFDRYWNVNIQRIAFRKLRFGTYERGSRADYFLKVVKEASYLDMPPKQEELIDIVVNHFPFEIQRGIVSLGLNTIDDVDRYLRKIDGTYFDEANIPGGNTNPIQNRTNRTNNNQSNWRNNDRVERYDRNGVNSREQRQVRPTNRDGNGDNVVATIFNRSYEDLVEEDKTVNVRKIVPVLNVKIESFLTTVLVDSGSQLTCVSQDYFDKILKIRSDVPTLPVNGVTVFGAIQNKGQQIKQQVFLNFEINEISFDFPCIVIPNLVRDVILGSDWMLEYSVVIDFEKFELRGIFKGTYQTVKLGVTSNNEVGVQEIRIEGDKLEIGVQRPEKRQYSVEEIKEVAFKAEVFVESDCERLNELLCEYQQIFSDQPGLMDVYHHEIVLRDSSPFHLKGYPIAHVYREEARSQIREMVEWGVIEKSQTEYVSPLVVVGKKDKSIRVCLDARFLNGRMVKDHVTPPDPNEFLFKFSPGQCLTTLDLSASYWQVPIIKDHRKYTGFSFEGDTYVFRVLPFGLSTSVGSFIRGLRIVLGDEIDKFVIMYVDDILVFSETAEDHFAHLRVIFTKLRDAGLTIKLRKCRFARRNIHFLGHILTPEGIQMDPDRIAAIMEFRAPRNIKELRSFLGLVNYDRRFCKGCSELVKPLLHVLKKKSKWNWGVRESDNFNKIKKAFLRVTMQAHPDPERRFYVRTDSSSFGLGACLYQLNKESGDPQVIAYYSRTLKGPELNYTVTELEALAIVASLKHWRIFVLGRDLTVVTDHKALSFLRTCKLLNSRLSRWVLYLQEYSFNIEYCRGSENVVADTLSRFPIVREEGSRMEVPDRSHIEIALLEDKSLSKKVYKNFKNILKAQSTDEFCCRVKAMLKEEDVPKRYSDWFIENEGLLFRRGVGTNPGHKLCIPKSQIVTLVAEEHQNNGHFGSAKCLAYLSRYYYWPKMRHTVRRIIAGCELCQKAKPCERLRGEMNSLVPNGPNEVTCLDIVGPLPVSRGGATQLLVVVDAFSKLVCLYALKRCTTKAILNALLNKYIVRVGKPRVVLSDNATYFSSHKWIEGLTEQGIGVAHTSVYFPQGNPTERVNKEIGRLLRSYCYAQHTRWGCVLKEIEGWLNRVLHDSTGFTPNQIHFSKDRENKIISNIPYPTKYEFHSNEIVLLARDNLLTKAAKRRERHTKLKRRL